MPGKVTGLTLIEVLIALAIISISLTAVIKAASQNIRATAYLQNKTLALWVGQEVMHESQLGLVKLPEGSDGDYTTVNILGQDMVWRGSEEVTGNVHIRKIHVKVYAHEPQNEEASPLIDLDGYRYHAN
jgi:general secretion pathway protein I